MLLLVEEERGVSGVSKERVTDKLAESEKPDSSYYQDIRIRWVRHH